MSMMNILKKLFRAAGEAYLDEKLPASGARRPASSARRKPAAKKPASPSKRPVSQTANRRKTGTASHSAKVYSDQSIILSIFVADVTFQFSSPSSVVTVDVFV